MERPVAGRLLGAAGSGRAAAGGGPHPETETGKTAQKAPLAALGGLPRDDRTDPGSHRLGLATRDWRTQAPREEDWPYYYRDQEEEPDMEEQPPRLPRAATGTGVTLEFAPASEERLTLSQIYEENQRSIVTIYAVSDWGVTQGTGIVFDRDGYIVTTSSPVRGGRRW